MKKRSIGILSIVGGLALVTGLTLGLVFGIKKSNEEKENLYKIGVKHLVDREFKEACEIFGSRKMYHYKDSAKKYNYGFNLQRYEQHAYNYENLIDYGMQEDGSKALVDFKTDGGEDIPRKKINKKHKGNYITEVPTKTHYDFVSWDLIFAGYEKESDSIRYVLESNYKDHPYEIDYELDGGVSLAKLPKSYFYNHGDVHIPDVAKEGYNFLGYESELYTDPTKDFLIPNGTFGDVSLTAKYSPLTYHISFNTDGGTPIPDPIDVVFGSDVSETFPTPSKNYYNFDYWTYKGEQVDLTCWSIAKDVTLKAHYSKIQFSISYELHGADGSTLPLTYGYGDSFTIPFVEKENAVFVGWKKGSDEPNPNYSISPSDHGDISLEAIFVDATFEEGKLSDISDKSIKEFIIPSFASDMSSEIVYQMPNLLNIFVDKANKVFSVKDRLLIKDGHIAFAYPIPYAPTKITLIEAINEIGANAFRGTEIQEIEGSSLVISKIGAGAFKDCSSLNKTNFANIDEVGNDAFNGTAITEDFLTANASTLSHIRDRAFKGTQIKEVNIGEKVQHVGDEAFANLSGFNTVTFKPSLDCEIGENIFDGCTGITTLNTNSKFFTKLMSKTFDDQQLKTINLEGGTNIEANACDEYESLEHLDLSLATLNQIGNEAFKGDTSLKDVALPNTLRRIKGSAFENCKLLGSVNFESLVDLMSIEGGAFKNTSLTSLDFTKNTHLTIDDGAFSSCSKLTSISLIHGQIVTRVVDVFELCGKINNVTYLIPETSDEKVELPNSLFENLNNVTNITIEYLGAENKEITFGNAGFKNCSSLENITMTNCHITSVPIHCFEGCSSLTNASGDLSNLESYGDGAFFGCSNLSHMSFTGTTLIGYEAFAGCYSLCDNGAILIPRKEDDTPIRIRASAFADITGEIKFDYSESEVDLYKGAPGIGYQGYWEKFDEGFSGTFTYLR